MVIRDGFLEELTLKLRSEGHIVVTDDGGQSVPDRGHGMGKGLVLRENISKSVLALPFKEQVNYGRNKMNKYTSMKMCENGLCKGVCEF